MFFISCLGGDDGTAGPAGARLVAESAGLSSSVPVEDPWTEIQALSASVGPALQGASDEVIELHRQLVAQFYGLDERAYEKDFDDRLANDRAFAESLTTDQVAAWRELNHLSRGRLVSSWDSRSGTPTRLEPWMHFYGLDGKTAYQDFRLRIGHLLDAMLGLSAEDELVLAEEQQFQTDDGSTHSVSPKTSVYQLHFRRANKGLPVFFDWMQITLRTSDWNPDAWFAFVSAGWTRDLPSGVPTIAAWKAVEAAQASGTLPQGTPGTFPRLGYYAQTGAPELAYEVVLVAPSAQWLYYVSATTGDLLWQSDQVMHYTGSLKINVGRAHEGTSKNPRPLPNTTIYEDPVVYTDVFTGCRDSATVNQETGQTDRVLGSTDYSGAYVNVTPIQAGDTTWTVDYRGTHVRDIGRQTTLDLGGFTAGSAYTFPQETTQQRSRRGEIYYHLNYANQLYRVAAYNVPVWEPQCFDYAETPAQGRCQNPLYQGDCCTGQASGYPTAGCVIYECNADVGLTAAPSVERWFRGLIFHEHNHMLQRLAGGCFYGCGGGPDTDGNECHAMEEGRAEYGRAVGTQAENVVSLDFPDLSYPTDYGCAWGVTTTPAAMIWTAIYLDYLMHSSLGVATKDIHGYLAGVNSGTRMVGLCTDLDGDGYNEVGECTMNSTYRHLLAANSDVWLAKYQRQHEISRIFHARVTDADRATPGEQSFPWADEMPNQPYPAPPFVAAEFGSYGYYIQTAPDPGSGSFRLETPTDYDTSMFVGRSGETYLVETTSLATGMDTYLEILNKVGNVVASNDNCSGSLRSCITFSPASTGYYRARVSPVAGTSTGPNKTYALMITPQGDDFGDTVSSASALVANGSFRNGTINSADDQDVFRIVSSAAHTLSYLTCSNSGLQTLVEVLGPNGSPIPNCSLTNTSCSTPAATCTLDRGVYFLRVSQPSDLTGAYLIRASGSPDIDVDSTAAHAWELGTDTTSNLVVGTRFETATDEDWFKFTASSGGIFAFETWGLDSGVDTVVEVYAPSDTIWGRYGTLDSLTDTSGGTNHLGHWMVKDDDSGLGARGSRVVMLAPLGGTYHIRVRNKAGADAGNYYFVFEDYGPYGGWPSYP